MVLHATAYFGVQLGAPDNGSLTRSATVVAPWFVSLEAHPFAANDELTAPMNSRANGSPDKPVARTTNFSPRLGLARVEPTALPTPSPSSADARPTSPLVNGIADESDSTSRGKGGTGSASRGIGWGRSESVHSTVSLTRIPQLVSESYRCGDLFPYDANSNHGVVVVQIEVGKDGSSTKTRVARSYPSAQGFDRAALACGRRLRFVPAMNAAGYPVRGHATVKLRFSRSS